MATLIFTQASPGAPALTGAAGSLVGLLDWGLAQNNWAIEYTATNARVYRAAVGKRRRLLVINTNGNGTGLAIVRGAEDASAATEAGLVNPFPTVAQVATANSSFLVSTATTGNREFVLVVGEDFVLLSVGTTGSVSANWDLFYFGDPAGAETADTWATCILVGNTGGNSGTSGRAMEGTCHNFTYAGKLFWCRDISGAVLSSRGCFAVSSNAASSATSFLTGADGMRTGYANRIFREKVGGNCIGSSSATRGATHIVKRGWIQNLWNPLHNGTNGLTSSDTFTDAAYHASSLFRICPSSSAVACILEASDTWSVPGG